MTELSELVKTTPEKVAVQLRPIARLTDPQYFIQEFYRQAQVCRTYEQAYEQTEQLYCWLFGENKYSSYQSFRQIKDRHNKKLRDK